MAELGTVNALPILRLAPEGALLDGGGLGELLLPLAQVPKGALVGQVLNVFVTKDGEGQLAATTRKPLGQRGEVACLKVVAVNKSGAFLAWGMPKDLLLPWKEVKHEQRHRLKEGQKVLVALVLDDQGRMAATARLDDFLSDEAEGLREGDKVTVMVAEFTEIGVRVVVNHRYWGLVHNSDIFSELTRGEVRAGWIKALRADHKLNVALAAPGYAKVDAAAQGVLDTLKRRGGFLPLTDKSRPEEIYDALGISKKVFKQTVGALYKGRRIAIEPEGIRLIDAP